MTESTRAQLRQLGSEVDRLYDAYEVARAKVLAELREEYPWLPFAPHNSTPELAALWAEYCAKCEEYHEFRSLL